jgi:hypothetical protein
MDVVPNGWPKHEKIQADANQQAVVCGQQVHDSLLALLITCGRMTPTISKTAIFTHVGRFVSVELA